MDIEMIFDYNWLVEHSLKTDENETYDFIKEDE